MIQTIKFENFKSWKTAEFELGKLTGLFGPNSSGKTSIIQLILLLKQTIESSDRAQILNFGDDKSYAELGTFKDIIHQHNEGNALKFTFNWKLKENLIIEDPASKNKTLFEGNELTFTADIRQQENKKRVQVHSFQYSFSNHKFILKQQPDAPFEYKLSHSSSSNSDFKFIRTKGRNWDLPHPIKCYGFPDQVNSYFQNTSFLSDLQLKFEELFSRVYYLGPLRDYPKRQYSWAGANPSDMGRRGEQVIDAMLASSEQNQKIARGKGKPKFTVEEYVAFWLQELKLIHSFRVHKIVEAGNLYRVYVKKTEESSEVLITDVGFGVSQILPVITLCYYAPEGSILIIEQPEIHLHPSVQAGLADIFIDAIKVKNVQIILESHSEHLLKRLQRRIAEDEIDSNFAKLFFCKNSNGVSKQENLKMDIFGNITNWPSDFFGNEIEEISATISAIKKRKKNIHK